MKTSNIVYIIIGVLLGGVLGYFLSTRSGSEDPSTEVRTERTESEQIYTCSMHPQIRQDEPGLCPICNMELIPLEESSSDDPLSLKMTNEAVKLAQVETVLVKGKSEKANGVLELSGRIKVNDDERYNEVAYFPGKVERLHIKSEGNYIQKGDKIADIFAPDLRVVQQELISTYQRRKENPELYSAAARKMKYWQIDKDIIIEIAESGIVRGYLPIYAEHSGYVKEIKVRQGDYITRGSDLMEVVDLSTVWIVFDVNESQLSKVRKGQQLTFTTLSYPGKEFKATINYIDPFIDPTTGTATVRATLRNYGNGFKPNMVIKGYASYSSRISDSELMVPASAVLWTGERSVVYVQDTTHDIPTYQYREVELGERLGEHYVVKEGISSGERVVRQGAFSIDAAAQLNNQMSMMNQWLGAEPKKVDHKVDMNPHAEEQWQQAIQHYLQLKDALVEGQTNKAMESAKELQGRLKATAEKLSSSKAQKVWKQWSSKASQGLSDLQETISLEKQREFFEIVSTAVIYWAQHLDFEGPELYIQYCPMAFDNEGANWLSDEEAIRNPYFGEAMLKCGKVTEVIE